MRKISVQNSKTRINNWPKSFRPVVNSGFWVLDRNFSYFRLRGLLTTRFFSLYLFAYLFHCFEKKDKKTPYSSQLAPTCPNLSKLIHTCQIVPESRNRVNIRPFWKLNGVFSPSEASYCSNPFEFFLIFTMFVLLKVGTFCLVQTSYLWRL